MTTEETWTKNAVIAYHTKPYQGCFDLYWDITAPLREGMDSETVAKMKTIKRAAWDAEEEK